MASESKAGRDCKVTLGANIILGVGSWSITGGSFAELDDTAFGDESMQSMRGLRTGGTVTFSSTSGKGTSFKVTIPPGTRDVYPQNEKDA